MSNHIHILAQSEVGDLSGFIRDFKNYSSKRFLEIIDGGKESRSDWLKLIFNYHGKF
jgi:REP element-mobilizing transposase RayT